MLLVLNMSVFRIYHGSHARVTQGSEYARICLDNSWICLNMPKSVLMACALHLLIVKEP